MKNISLIIAAITLITGCEPTQQNVELQPINNAQQNVNINPIVNNRIKIERLSIVRDSIAYGGERGTYLITDTKTGQEFIGISGIGISTISSHSPGKTMTSDER